MNLLLFAAATVLNLSECPVKASVMVSDRSGTVIVKTTKVSDGFRSVSEDHAGSAQ
jgi:hypothetical protein